MIVRTCRIDGNQRYSWIKNQRSLFVSRTRDHAAYASRQSTDVEAPRSQLEAATSTRMARPGRPERNRPARSFRQITRFHHVINSDKFSVHTRACPGRMPSCKFGVACNDKEFH